MRRKRLKAELREHGHAKRGGQDVSSGRREAHSENERNYHNERESEERDAMREREDDADELDADAGQRDGGEDDASRGAGYADERDALDAAVNGVDYRLRPHAVLGLRKRDEPREEGAYRGGAHRRHAHE